METQNQYPDIPEFISKMAKAAAGSMRSRGLSIAEDQSDQEQNILLHILLKTGNMQDLRNLSESDVREMIASFMKSKKREIARQQTDLGSREALIADMVTRSTPFEPSAVMRLDINRAQNSYLLRSTGFSNSITARKAKILPYLAVYCGVRNPCATRVSGIRHRIAGRKSAPVS